jgi:hypothetical protein
MKVSNPLATAFIGALFLLANLGNALYALGSRAPSGGFALLYYMGFGYAVAYWIHADNRRLGRVDWLDQGWLLFALWPVALPYHLFKTRGWRGAVTLAGLIALFLATYAVGLLAFFALRSRAAQP